MAKEIIPPDPIPIKSNSAQDIEDTYCASFLNYSEEAYSKTSRELIDCLEEKYTSVGFGGTTRSFIAENSKVNDIYEDILNANISGITKNTFDKHVLMNQSGDDVMIFAMLY